MASSNDLPVELWMRVLDFVETDDYARPARVERYATALETAVPGGSNSGNNGVEKKAVEELPPFERRAWKNIRPFYAINSNSRAAAIKLRLSRKLMLACRKSIVSAKSCGTSLVLLLPLKDLTKSGDCATIQLWEWPSPFPYLKLADFLKSTSRACLAYWNRMISGPFSTKPVALRHVVLLGPDTYPSDRCPETDLIKEMGLVCQGIKQVWMDQGVHNGEVEVWL